MSEMVERAAGALLNVQDNLPADDRWGHVYIATHKDALHDGDCTKRSYTCYRCVCDGAMKEVRTVVEFLREPTEAMAVAARNSGAPDREPGELPSFEHIWRAAIDAALGKP